MHAAILLSLIVLALIFYSVGFTIGAIVVVALGVLFEGLLWRQRARGARGRKSRVSRS